MENGKENKVSANQKQVIKKSGRDRIFVIVLTLTFGNIIWWTMWTIINMFNDSVSFLTIAIFISDLVAIIGILWLLKSYRKSVKVQRQVQKELEIRNQNDKKEK